MKNMDIETLEKISAALEHPVSDIETPQTPKSEKIIESPLTELYSFENHPLS